MGLVQAVQQPARDVASNICLSNYFLCYAFYVVMVSIGVFRVKWTHRSDQSSDSRQVRSRVKIPGSPSQTFFDRQFNEPSAISLKV